MFKLWAPLFVAMCKCNGEVSVVDVTQSTNHSKRKDDVPLEPTETVEIPTSIPVTREEALYARVFKKYTQTEKYGQMWLKSCAAMQVEVSTLDVADRGQTQQLLELAGSMAPVAGIFHLAATWRDRLLSNQVPWALPFDHIYRNV